MLFVVVEERTDFGDQAQVKTIILTNRISPSVPWILVVLRVVESSRTDAALVLVVRAAVASGSRSGSGMEEISVGGRACNRSCGGSEICAGEVWTLAWMANARGLCMGLDGKI